MRQEPQPSPADPPPLKLRLRDGDLYVVRWVRLDGSQVKQRFYRRPQQAAAMATRLKEGGWEVAVFTSRTSWIDVTTFVPTWLTRGRRNRTRSRP